MKVTTYCINKGTASQYFRLKNAEENTVLHHTPTWKTEKGAIRWAIKNGFEVVEDLQRMVQMYIFILFVFCVLFSIIFGALFDSYILFIFGFIGLSFLWFFVIFIRFFL